MNLGELHLHLQPKQFVKHGDFNLFFNRQITLENFLDLTLFSGVDVTLFLNFFKILF